MLQQHHIREQKVVRLTPATEHEIIPVPAVVSQELFAAVAERLEDNRRRLRTRAGGPRFLLSGLLVCGRCGSAYCGRSHRSGDHQRTHVYYRCLATDKRRYGGVGHCASTAVGQSTEDAVWADVCELLANPEHLRRELDRRQRPSAPIRRRRIANHHRSIAPSVGSGAGPVPDGGLDEVHFSPAFRPTAEPTGAAEERAYAEQQQAFQQRQEQAELLANFDRFVQIRTGLAEAEFATKRQILALLIKRIEVGQADLTIVYKVQLPPFAHSPNRGCLQHRLNCLGRLTPLNHTFPPIGHIGPRGFMAEPCR